MSVTRPDPGRNPSPLVAVGRFAPNMPADEWETIKDFVLSSVAACEDRVPGSPRVLVRTVAPLARWTWLNGIPLERDVVFRRAMVGRFIEQEYTALTKTTRNTYRSRLLRIGEALAPDRQDYRLPGLGRDFQSAPYSTAEQASFRSWANGQRTTGRRSDAGVLLALGFGAGLMGGEIAAVKHEHIQIDDCGVLVDVVGRRPRTVPVLAAWENALVDAADSDHDPEAFVFRPGAKRNHPNIVAHFARDDGHDISTSRMRSTWIAEHLVSGVPAKALLRISGADSFTAFHRLLPYLPEPDLTQARPLFRGSRTQLD